MAGVRIVGWLIIATLVAGCESTPLPPAPDGAAVGMQRFNWIDESRQAWDGSGPRPITTTVWYPTDDTEQDPVLIPKDRPILFPGYAAIDSPLQAGPAPYPVAVLSHGTGGSALQMMWLGRALAAHGYVALSVDHHGNTAAEPKYDPRGFRLAWERASDLSQALDRLSEDPDFGSHVDLGNVSAIGFSLGGYTVTALAGARTDLDRLESFCAGPERDETCEPQTEYPDASRDFQALRETDPAITDSLRRASGDYRDPRIKKVVTLAPAIAQAFTPTSLAAIELPFLVLVGDQDDIAPAKTNGGYLAEHLPKSSMTLIPGVGHFVFLSLCTERGRRYVPICKDPAHVTRAEVHMPVIDLVVSFLEQPQS